MKLCMTQVYAQTSTGMLENMTLPIKEVQPAWKNKKDNFTT